MLKLVLIPAAASWVKQEKPC